MPGLMMFQFAGKTSFLFIFCVFVLWTLPGFPQTVLLTDHPGTGSYEFGQEMARLFGEALSENEYPLTVRPWSESSERLSICLLYTSPSPRDGLLSRMPSSA